MLIHIFFPRFFYADTFYEPDSWLSGDGDEWEERDMNGTWIIHHHEHLWFNSIFLIVEIIFTFLFSCITTTTKTWIGGVGKKFFFYFLCRFPLPVLSVPPETTTTTLFIVNKEREARRCVVWMTLEKKGLFGWRDLWAWKSFLTGKIFSGFHASQIIYNCHWWIIHSLWCSQWGR